MEALKMIQIVAAQWSEPKSRDRKYTIYGLDASGQVYHYMHGRNAWIPISMERYLTERSQSPTEPAVSPAPPVEEPETV